MAHKSLVGLAFLLIALIGCQDKEQSQSKESSTPRIVKVTKIISPKSGQSFSFGSSIPFQVESKETIDSITVEFGKQSKTYESAAFNWTPEFPRTGNLKIRVKIYFGGESETHYPKLKLLSDVTPEPLTYSIIQTLPHNPLAYTQGYFFKEDTLIESTGQNGTSWLSKVNLKTGVAFTKINLDPEYFGEGSAYWGGNYYQLTWTSQTGFIYDASFNQLKTFTYAHEGWGMATWGDTLLVSDGTEVIHFLDPRDLSEIDRLEVYEGSKPLKNLNELEVVDGLLYANIYPEDEVAIIELATGRVIKIADLSGLLTSSESRQADVLNGIARHPNGKLYFTGKLWPKTFELQLTPKPN